MPSIIVLEDDSLHRALLLEELLKMFPHMRILTPESWQEALPLCKQACHETIIVTDGLLWTLGGGSPVTAHDVLDLVSPEAVGGILLFSGKVHGFPRFPDDDVFDKKGGLPLLLERVRTIFERWETASTCCC